MKKHIPNVRIKSYIYKDFTVKDLIVFSMFILVAVAVLLIKNKIAVIFAGILLTMAFISLLKLNDDRLYVFIKKSILFKFSKKNYSQEEFYNELSAIKAIHEEYIELQNGDFLKIFQINGINMNILSEEEKGIEIKKYNTLLRNIINNGQVKIIKIDQSVDYSKQKEKRIKRTTDNELIKEINENEIIMLSESSKQAKVPFYYLLIRVNKLEVLQSDIKKSIDKYNEDNILLRELKAKEYTDILHDLYLVEKEKFDVKDLIPCGDITFSFNCFTMDGKKKFIYRIKSLPYHVDIGYLSKIFSYSGIKIVTNIFPVNKEKAVKNIDRTIMDLQFSYDSTSLSSKKTEIENNITALNEIIKDVKSDGDSIVSIELFVIIEAKDIVQFRKLLATLNIKMINETYLQKESYFNTMFSMLDNNIDKGLILSLSTFAFAYPFQQRYLCDAEGFILGHNEAGALEIVDFDKREKSFTNSNMVVVGKAGSGKSYLVKHLVASFAANNEEVYILDPENEYANLVQNLGGEVIDVSSSSFKINPLEIMDKDYEGGFESHLSFLDSFFKTIFNLNNSEFEILNKIVLEFYLSFKHNDNCKFNKIDRSPTFADLYEYIVAHSINERIGYFKEVYNKILIEMDKCVNGRYARLWNSESRIDINSSLVVFKFQNLFQTVNLEFAAVQMMLISRYLNNKLLLNYRKILDKNNSSKKLNIVVDEAHRFLGTKDEIALQMMYTLAKQCRKYGCRLITITQSIADFLSNEQTIRETKAIISESQYSFILGMGAQHIQDLIKLYSVIGISEKEIDIIRSQGIGEAFLIASNNVREKVSICGNETAVALF